MFFVLLQTFVPVENKLFAQLANNAHDTILFLQFNALSIRQYVNLKLLVNYIYFPV